MTAAEQTARLRAVWALVTANPRISHREIARAIGAASPATGHRWVRRLERAGYIEQAGERAIRVIVPLYTRRD